MEHQMNAHWQRKIKYGVLVEIKVPGENLTSTTSSAINSFWTALRQNPGLCGKKPASNNLKCGIVYTLSYVVIWMLNAFLGTSVILQSAC
jgi:hypothetical protein